MLRGSMMFAGRGSLSLTISPDRLGAFPRDIASQVDAAGHQRQPFLAPLASRSLPGAHLDQPRRRAQTLP